MSAHTPGPWHLDSVNRIRSAHGVHIGEVATSWTHGYMAPAETVANGKIMAASPELVGALALILELATNGLDHAHPRNSASISAIAAAAQAALAKSGVAS
ncbi:MAG TPA: hypothetical protein VLH36_03655 [Steroidobacteraceae bacterium]|nr:hypothetical protein [Steroidobacteraceae bacterium]